MKQSLAQQNLQVRLPRKSNPVRPEFPGWTLLGNGFFMLLLVAGIFSNPFFQLRLVGSQAENALPECPPLLIERTHPGFENPALSKWRSFGIAVGNQGDEPTEKITNQNPSSAISQETVTFPIWQLGKSPLWVQDATETAVSWFGDTITIQLPLCWSFPTRLQTSAAIDSGARVI